MVVNIICALNQLEAVENFANLKGLEDEAEELEEMSKLALSPVGVYSTQVSPNPSEYLDDMTERAEEALALIQKAATAAATSVTSEPPADPQTMLLTGGEEPAQPVTASEPATPAPEPVLATAAKGNGRRTSHSWRGLKKQLSRVDLKLKNTFNATPAKKASTFYGEQSENDEAGGGSLPQIITEGDGQEQQRPDGGGGVGGGSGGVGQSANDHSSTSTATRPTELKLFDRDGKPIKPPRSSKEHRKRTSLDKQGNLTAGAAASSRDARLLSVPNIKYSQRDQKHNRSNNQAFINLIKRLSKLKQNRLLKCMLLLLLLRRWF